MFKAVHCAKFSTCPRTDPLHVTRSCHNQTFTCNLHSQVADGHLLSPAASCSRIQQQGRRVARSTAAHKTSTSGVIQYADSVLPDDQPHEQTQSGQLLKQGPVLASQHQEQQVHKQQPSAQTMTCRRCYQCFSTAENSSKSCSFHPAMYTGGEVAKAIGFVRESSAPEHQLGAVVGHTGLMRFWDCCGASDSNAPGCVQGFHLSFDEQINEDMGWRE